MENGNDNKHESLMMTMLSQLIAHGVGSAMRGALVARFVEGCLSLLSPPRSRRDKGEEAEMNKRSTAMGDKGDNLALQLKAPLRTLLVLLNGLLSADLCRSMLPGCFAGFY